MAKINEMSKKDFKSYVKKNGFFLNFQADMISRDDVDSVQLENSMNILKRDEIPSGENIVIFKGQASTNFPKGKMSRNGYKIDQKGRDLKNYAKNPIVLLQHNQSYGGIGKGIKFGFDSAGSLQTVFYVDTNTLGEREAYQVKNGYIKGISTSHIQHETKFEDTATGDLLTKEEARDKYGIEEVWGSYWGASDKLIVVSSKSEFLEQSLVSLPSNPDAMVGHNGLGDQFIYQSMQMFNEIEKLTQAQYDSIAEQLKNSSDVENVEEVLEGLKGKIVEENEEKQSNENEGEEKKEDATETTEAKEEDKQEETSGEESKETEEVKEAEKEGESTSSENGETAENAETSDTGTEATAGDAIATEETDTSNSEKEVEVDTTEKENNISSKMEIVVKLDAVQMEELSNSLSKQIEDQMKPHLDKLEVISGKIDSFETDFIPNAVALFKEYANEIKAIRSDAAKILVDGVAVGKTTDKNTPSKTPLTDLLEKMYNKG